MGTVLVSDGVWDQGNWDALGAGDSPAVGWSLGDALGAGDGSAIGWPWGVRSRPREHSEPCERGEPGWPCLTWGLGGVGGGLGAAKPPWVGLLGGWSYRG